MASAVALLEEEEAELAKKKAAKAGRPASDRGPRGPVLTIKAYPEWREWLDEFRAFCQETGEVAPDNASLVDLMAISYARAKGFRLPPPR